QFRAGVDESVNRVTSHRKVVLILLDPDALVANRLGRRQGGARPGERVHDHPLRQWQQGTNDLAKKSLRLQAGMRSHLPLFLTSRSRLNHVAEGPILTRTTEPARTPLSQVILDPSFDRFAINE